MQSRIKMLEKVVPIEVPPERKTIHFDFPTCAKSGRTVIELKHARQAYGELVVLEDVNLHVERGDRIALVGPNGVGKSTLMRMLSGEEAPRSGQRSIGHNVVMQYFAQDEATRLDPAPTVYETLSSGSPLHMVPMIRNILGGFLFSGDDINKRVRVLSGGERTRLAVARMLLRPSNLLLLDEPTNHLDLDSKEVLLDALVDYGGTLIFVSHDRYFVERLATKIIEVGNGDAVVYPGTYKEFLWHKEHPEGGRVRVRSGGSEAGSREERSRDGSGRHDRLGQADRTSGGPGQVVRPSQHPRAKKRSAPTLKRANASAPCKRSGSASITSKPASPNARRRSVNSRRRWPRLGSMRIERPPSRSSIAITLDVAGR